MSMVKKQLKRLTYLPKEMRYQVRRLRYLIPNPFASTVPLSPTMQRSLEELRRNGVAKITGRYEELADLLTDKYLTPQPDHEIGSVDVEAPANPFIHHHINRRDAHRVETHMSFKDPALKSLYFDAELCGLACNYYHRQAFYRNHPAIWATYFHDESCPFRTGKFHKDGGVRQLTFMLLLKDLTEDDTHMQYAAGSQREATSVREFARRNTYSDEKIAEKYPIVPCVGKKGTMFIFDAGNGFHRALFRRNSVRIHMHLIVTSGVTERDDQLYPWDSYRDTTADWSEYAAMPRHARRMVEKLVVENK